MRDEKRDTNVARLIEWCAFGGEDKPRKYLQAKLKCSKSTIDQMFRGVTPGRVMRLRASSATKIPLDELFPLVCDTKEKSA